jgi:hypothetical protein
VSLLLIDFNFNMVNVNSCTEEWCLFLGYAPKFDEVVIAGSVEDLNFVAHYIVGDRVAAVATVGGDAVAAKFAELISTGKQLLKSDLQPDALAWTGKF